MILEKSPSSKYAVTGGKLEWKDFAGRQTDRVNGDVLDYQDAIEKLLIRETKEEAGIDIHQIFNISIVWHLSVRRSTGHFDKILRSVQKGNVVPKKAHLPILRGECRGNQVYQCIDGIKEEVAQTVAHYTKK